MSDIWWKEKCILTQKINVTEQIRREGEGDRRKYISYCLLKIILCETSYSVSIVILLKWWNTSLQKFKHSKYDEMIFVRYELASLIMLFVACNAILAPQIE